MDKITESLSRLQELTNDELAELEENVLSEFATTEQQELTSQSADMLTQLADVVGQIRAEKSRRVTAAQALKDQAAEAAARIQDGIDNAEAAEAADMSDDEPVVEDEVVSETETEIPETVVSEEESPVVEETVVEDSTTEETTEDEKKEDDEEEKPVVASSEGTTEVETELAVEEPAAVETQTPETELAVEEDVQEESSETEAAADVEDSAELSEDEPAEAELAVEETVDSELSNEETHTESTPEAVVTASSNSGEGLNLEVPADHTPVINKPAVTTTIVAGADIQGISAGTVLKDDMAVADAFIKRLNSVRRATGGGAGEQHIVASYRQEFPENRFLEANNPLSNTARIQEVSSTGAIVAAAGVCTPLETVYDIGCEVGTTDRPVRDALARFGADRGGVRYFTAPTLAQTSPAFADATGFWRRDGLGAWHTYESDRTTATTPADTKPCLEMNCAQENEAFVEAVTLCLTFNNLTTRTFPELIKRQNELAMVAHARVAEDALLAQIEAGSTAVTAQAQVVGATREILNLFEKAAATYRHKHRVGSTPLRALIPVWVKNLMRADIALQMPGDGMETFDIAESKIDAWFKSRGINPTWHLDGIGPSLVDLDGAGSGTAVGFEFPSTIEFALFAEGTWLFLDGGSLDIGVIRDSSLVATNQYKQFVETFEGVANVGCDSYWISAAYEPCGSAAALVETCAA